MMSFQAQKFKAVMPHLAQVSITGQTQVELDVFLHGAKLHQIFHASSPRLSDLPDRFVAKILMEGLYEDADLIVLRDGINPLLPLTKDYLWVSYQRYRPSWVVRLCGWVPGFSRSYEVCSQMFLRDLSAYR